MKSSLRKRDKELSQRYNILLTDKRTDFIVDRAIEKSIDINTILEGLSSVYNRVKDFEEGFFNKHSIKITFEDGALDKIAKKAMDKDEDAFDICSELVMNYEHGFKLIRERAQRDEFLITEDAVENPEGYLSKLIKESYTAIED